MASMATLSDPFDDTLEMVPPDPVSCKILDALLSVIALELAKVPAPLKIKVLAPRLNPAPLYVSVLPDNISMVLPEETARVPEWVAVSLISRVPPFKVVVPANVPDSPNIRLLELGTDTDERVSV